MTVVNFESTGYVDSSSQSLMAVIWFTLHGLNFIIEFHSLNFIIEFCDNAQSSIVVHVVSNECFLRVG